MKKIILLRGIIVLLVLVFGYESYSYINEINNSKENKVLETIQISDNLKEAKQIAIMQQKTDFTWEDIGTSASAWPDIKTFEYYGSECTDATGKDITPTTSVIQFDEQNQTATISTSKTIYCTLKFARRSKVLELMQETTADTYLKSIDTSDELLRYVGTQSDVTGNKINNFICFGTENKDTCLGDKGTYMYRIIGITTDKVNTSLGLAKNQLKIIKATPSNTSQAWNSNYTSDVKWDSADVQKTYLNTTFIKTITGITTKVGTHTWESLISNPKWYIADNKSSSGSSFTDTTEKDTTTLSDNHKIGLMYASDYHNSFNYASYYNTANSWLHITSGTSNSSSYSSTCEWTMTRRGPISSRVGYYYYAWYVNSDGSLYNYGMNNPYAVRPVFYLTSEISISGAGTESDPFIISDRIDV